MRVPLEWLTEYLNTNKPAKEPKKTAESFTLLGLMLDKTIDSSKVLDLEHRMDRSDWLSIVGCARDLAAFENLELKMPPLNKQEPKKPQKDQLVNIEIKCPDVVNRFNTRVFRGITVKDSPKWLKNRLEAYGIPSINNIVDITNYVMVELGQPMHAQDLAKMEAQEIVIRKAKEGETVTTLLGETIALTPDQFVLTQNDKPTVIGGIVGGNTTGVDSNTTDIVLDAGNYDQNNVRGSSRQLKIQNETVLRYDKFLHPKLTEIALERATYLILELAGGEYYENIDWYPNKHPLKKLVFRTTRLEQVGGTKIGLDRIKQILTKLEYNVLTQKVVEGGIEFEIEVPYFRTDVVVEDDVVADILRINNYNAIPVKLIGTAPPKEITLKIYIFENKLRDYLISAGLHEHITESLVAVDEEKTHQVVLENALTTDKGALRTEMLSGLQFVANNYEKHNRKKISLFEIGKTYHVRGAKDKYENYDEVRTLQVYHNNLETTPKKNAVETKQFLASLMQSVGVENYDLVKTDKGVRIEIGGEKVGHMDIYCFCLLTEQLIKHQKQSKRVVSELKNLSKENLSVVIDLDEPFGPIYKEIKNFDKNIHGVEVIEEYVGEKIAPDKKAVLVEIVYATSDTENIRKKLIKTLESNFDAKIRA